MQYYACHVTIYTIDAEIIIPSCAIYTGETTPTLKTTAAVVGLLPHTRDFATPKSSSVPLASNSKATIAHPSTCTLG